MQFARSIFANCMLNVYICITLVVHLQKVSKKQALSNDKNTLFFNKQ